MPRNKEIDPVRIQFIIGIKKKREIKIPREILEHVIRRWMQKQPLPKGIRIRAVLWKNPDRAKSTSQYADARSWRVAGNADAARRFLRFKEPFIVQDENPESARDSLANITLAASIQFAIR